MDIKSCRKHHPILYGKLIKLVLQKWSHSDMLVSNVMTIYEERKMGGEVGAGGRVSK